MRAAKYSDLTWKRLVCWKTTTTRTTLLVLIPKIEIYKKLVTDERWSLTRGSTLLFLLLLWEGTSLRLFLTFSHVAIISLVERGTVIVTCKCFFQDLD